MARYSPVYYADRRVGVWDIMADTYKHWLGINKERHEYIGCIIWAG